MPLSCSEGFTELGYYNGTVSQTDSGAPCLKWTEFPDYVMQYPGRGLGDHNYCRNPDRESNPWCFFRQNSGAIGWAYCDCHQGISTDALNSSCMIKNKLTFKWFHSTFSAVRIPPPADSNETFVSCWLSCSQGFHTKKKGKILFYVKGNICKTTATIQNPKKFGV